MNNKTMFGPFAFRHFLWTTEAGKLAWTATLRRNGSRVGTAYAKAGKAAPRILFESDGERILLERHVAQIPNALIPLDLQCDRRVEQFLLALADETYHARRLQMMSIRHTVFRLTDDAEETYRYLPNLPPGAEVIGRLRLIYGERLARVLREEDIENAPAGGEQRTRGACAPRRVAAASAATPSIAAARG